MPTPFPAISWWVPSRKARYQIQFVDYPIDLTIEADIFEVDLFETPQQTIDELHAMGKKVVCYINAGAWEDFRPDAGEFPDEIIGHDYIGWPGEKWLDVSRFEIFSHIMEARFDLAMEKGCDAVETDNVQGYTHPTGFNISFEDQLTYNRWLSEQAHTRELGIGFKNDPEQISGLLPNFDFAVAEDCAAHNECALYRPFIEAGKAVFQVEYTDQFTQSQDFCGQTIANGYSGLFKNRRLDAWVEICR